MQPPSSGNYLSKLVLGETFDTCDETDGFDALNVFIISACINLESDLVALTSLLLIKIADLPPENDHVVIFSCLNFTGIKNSVIDLCPVLKLGLASVAWCKDSSL